MEKQDETNLNKDQYSGEHCENEEKCSGLCCTKVEHFSVNFGNTKVLEDVNLHIHCGELTAIIGPNGGGKSTLLKAMLGDVKHSGQLSYLSEHEKNRAHPVIGYVPQHLSFDIGTPTSVLDLFMVCNSKIPAWLTSTKKIISKVKESLSIVKSEHLINRRMGALSGGELQRVLLALALDPIPDLLLLDEPVSGIDQKGLEVFYDTVSELRRKYDLSIVLISHDLDIVEKYADRVILLNGKVLCNGSPKEVFNNEITTKIFGMSWFKRRPTDHENDEGRDK
ncbi:ATP-binding cassette domain-containing protein [Acetobacterium paludosum]|uniref:ATP-binding cassette domain-containing protein n=1 Tax=Acetobacterium paludosum TaxID=52693 RepID=A0A923HT78_9FIRM|nr:metal ABC transporter ATP-binding protein [Acetobacterium paludosum]MBC3888209.1 ATP-binding cassette domain-containing protein [Acetobacterium paludosum]